MYGSEHNSANASEADIHLEQEDCPASDPDKPTELAFPLAQVLCLGIGKISESRESQFQFIQLQDISNFLEVSIPSPISASQRKIKAQFGREARCGSTTLCLTLWICCYLSIMVSRSSRKIRYSILGNLSQSELTKFRCS